MQVLAFTETVKLRIHVFKYLKSGVLRWSTNLENGTAVACNMVWCSQSFTLLALGVGGEMFLASVSIWHLEHV